MAETVNFDQDKAGTLPAGWKSGVTGRGAPKWTIEKDDTAPTPPNVLKQSGSGTFPWCVKTDTSIENGAVEVKFKPISGREDAAGGLVWRWKDGDNYYVARANALEDNVRLYKVVGGSRKQFAGAKAKVSSGEWHTLKLAVKGNHFRISFDDKLLFEADDDTFKEAGKVGLWTKADSVTYFDDLTIESHDDGGSP